MDERILESAKKAISKYEELTALISSPEVFKDSSKLKEIGKERSALEELAGKGKEYVQLFVDISDAESITRSSEDKELVELAKQELDELEEKRVGLEKEIRLLLLPRDPNDDKNAIVEIRAGTGGDEAALFAGEMFRMYSKYAESRNWKVEVLGSSETGTGGMKEAIFLVEGKGAFGRLKHERGVHRVQRVPETEASGRIHTSAVTVAVLLEAEEIDVQISPDELEIDVFRSSGPGGQSVNTADSAVRIKHVPTGLVVQCQDERSQLKNKAKALKVLRARLLDMARKDQDEKLAQDRRSQVGSGDRSEKIRTYNFPQGRVTDHRIGLTLHKLNDVLEGKLDEFIDSLAASQQDDRLKLKAS
ncbi:MAG: peptide chain release factor 1 [Candidatus Eisenbacteria bacterium]|nr:peptide chain release factor 1 [Candidatus Eisenbacteria bacterium]